MLRAAIAVLVLVAACTTPERAPPAGTLDGGVSGPVWPPPTTRPRRDGGTALDGAVVVDGGAAEPGCASSEGTANAVRVARGGEPIAFELRTTFVTWNHLACGQPAILIGLSDGACTPGVGAQLLFSLDRAAIDTSLIRIGANPIDPESGSADPIGVRLFGADSTGAPLVWGNCADATGTLDVEDIDTVTGSRLRASFSLSLTDCAELPAQPPLDVTGTFDVVLSVPFESVCL